MPPPSTPGTSAAAVVDDVTDAIARSAASTKTELAALFTALERREDRVARFAAERDAVATSLETEVSAAWLGLDALMPDEVEGGPVLAAERERMREHVAQRAAAQRDEHRETSEFREMVNAMSEARLRLQTYVKLERREGATMHDWFHAPAARVGASLSPVKF